MKALITIAASVVFLLSKTAETDPFSIRSMFLSAIPISEVNASNGLELNIEYKIDLKPKLPNNLKIIQKLIHDDTCMTIRMTYETPQEDCVFNERQY